MWSNHFCCLRLIVVNSFLLVLLSLGASAGGSGALIWQQDFDQGTEGLSALPENWQNLDSHLQIERLSGWDESIYKVLGEQSYPAKSSITISIEFSAQQWFERGQFGFGIQSQHSDDYYYVYADNGYFYAGTNNQYGYLSRFELGPAELNTGYLWRVHLSEQGGEIQVSKLTQPEQTLYWHELETRDWQQVRPLLFTRDRGLEAQADNLLVSATAPLSPGSLSGDVILTIHNHGSGQVLVNRGTWRCAQSCDFTVPQSEPVTLKPVAEPGWQFAGWDGACRGQGDECQLAMSSAKHTRALWAPAADRLHTYVKLQVDSAVTAGDKELVVFGLPLASGVIQSTEQIQIFQGDQPIESHVEAGMMWHWRDGSVRSATVQLPELDLTQGDVWLTVTDGGQGQTIPEPLPYHQSLSHAGTDKEHLPFPRILVTHDPYYLSQSGIVPPFRPVTDESPAMAEYLETQFEHWAGSLNFTSSSNANWLFDRASALFKAYMVTGDARYLKEAYLSKQFYFNYVRSDDVPPRPEGGRGCWTYKSTACADGKYIAPQQAKLAWALTGDSTQWDESLLVDMALQADKGWNQHPSRDPYDSESEGFTERGAGLVGLAELNVFEMTANEGVLAHLNERIESLKDMQQAPKQWDKDNDWLPMPGYFRHSYRVHEGMPYPGDGMSDDRAGSPWMSENIADFLWQAYWLLDHSDVPEMLRRLANAVEQYGFTSSFDAESESFITKPGFTEARTRSCNTRAKSTAMLYFMSDLASVEQQSSESWHRWYTDTHNIETLLTLSAGVYFESSVSARQRLLARLEALYEGWVNPQCAKLSMVPRLWNWQHRSNSVQTYAWVLDELNKAVELSVSDGGRIAGDRECADRCRLRVDPEDVINLTAKPDTGFEFVAWSGLCRGQSDCQLTRSRLEARNNAVEAHFRKRYPDKNQPIFFQHRPEALEGQCRPDNSFGVHLADFNGDGHPDKLALDHQHLRKYGKEIGRHCLWLNNGAGRFELDTVASEHLSGADDIACTWSAQISDFNGDDKADFWCRGTEAGSDFFENHSAKGAETLVFEHQKAWRAEADTPYAQGYKDRFSFADFNGDGVLDRINRQGRIRSLDDGRLLFDTQVKEPVWADFNQDGWPDLWSLADKKLLLNDQGQGFTIGQYQPAFDICDYSGGIFHLDYDKDGALDLFCVTASDEPQSDFHVLLNQPDGYHARALSAEDLYPDTYASVALTKGTLVFEDMDNNGYADLVTIGPGQKLRLLMQDSQGDFNMRSGAAVLSTPEVPLVWYLAADDIDQDGLLDLAISAKNAERSSAWVYTNESSVKNHSLRLSLNGKAMGKGQNIDGIGSRVLVYKAGTDQLLAHRLIAPDYRHTGPARGLHIGLGKNERVDIQVVWPNAWPASQRFENIQVDQHYQIVFYPEGSDSIKARAMER
ncbi:hypothetical protein HMF8227_01184 [Saliniradius amylolyticus]|uniref:ASPIC/UnbV domain-containing protein n=1 Tax=Saliniradius amylolyticus TaxID=2183582 RepID=A0A2S2E1Z0_9ALTE|nr:FG-GAP-like repeat-containing protein [Saliniradius amylolyticus]AWL11665.1 hypothetical protein HMF8227_01184 [Saliniradius amylolyticus]